MKLDNPTKLHTKIGNLREKKTPSINYENNVAVIKDFPILVSLFVIFL